VAAPHEHGPYPHPKTKKERGIVIVREKNLDFWIFLIVLCFWLAVIVLHSTMPYIIGGGVAAGVAWLLRHRADRDDARREHELALEREKTKQLQLQLVRDEALWRRALEEQTDGRR